MKAKRWAWGALGALAVAALAYLGSVLSTFTVDWIRTGVARAGIVEFWVPIIAGIIVWGLAAAIVVLFALTLFRSSWTKATWGPLRRFLGWIASKSMTSGQRDRIVQEGYERRTAEIIAERAREQRPAWGIAPRDDSFGDEALFWLENHGWTVWDVTLSADPNYFITAGDVLWRGDFGVGRAGRFNRQVLPRYRNRQGSGRRSRVYRVLARPKRRPSFRTSDHASRTPRRSGRNARSRMGEGLPRGRPLDAESE